MSLINDVLRDLAKREPRAPGALSGIQVVPESRRRGQVRRLSAFLSGILIALFILGTGWFLLTLEKTSHPTRSPPRSAGTMDHAGIKARKPVSFAAPPSPKVQTAPSRPRSLSTMGPSRGPLSRPVHGKPTLRPAPLPPVASTQSLDIHSAPPATPAEQVQVELLEARRDLRHGHGRRAILRFRAALSLEPRNTAIRLALGGLEVRLGNLPAAQALLLAGIHLPSTNRRARDALINLLARTGNTSLAWQEIRHHPPTHPRAHLHYLKLAAALAQLTAHWPMAAHLYGEILTKRPGAAWAWAGRGIALEQSGQTQRALQADRRALALGDLAPTLTLYLERRIRFLEKVAPTHEPPAR